MFGENDAMAAMYVTETIGTTDKGDVSVQKVGDTEKFRVYFGNDTPESYRYGDQGGYSYSEARELAINYAVGVIKGAGGDVTHDRILR